MDNVWALCNQKGGVGKSAATANLGHELTRAGEKVLVVDCDPQATTTAITDTEPNLNHYPQPDPTLYEVLTGECPLTSAINWSDAWGFDVAPATLSMARLEQQVSPGSEFRLAEALGSMSERYDRILLDLPPSLGRFTLMGLIAADHALIVTEPSYPALRGVSDLLETLEVVTKRYAPRLALAGVVVNKVVPTREAMLRVEELDGVFGSQVWTPHIPHRTALAEALGAHVPVRAMRGDGARVVTEAFAGLAAVMQAHKPTSLLASRITGEGT
jgi:chromosome partitioning protein